jgi:hypothetical protein
VLDSCGVERAPFRAFVSSVRAAHRDNAFHNWWHIADVTHATSLLLREARAGEALRPEEAFALLLAGTRGRMRSAQRHG